MRGFFRYLLCTPLWLGLAYAGEGESPPPAPPAEKAAPAEKKKEENREKPKGEEIVVTATRLPTPREQTGIAMNTVTAGEVEVNQDDQAAEILRMVPGLQVNQNGRKGDFSSIMMRGGESDQTLILYDGWKVNNQGGFFSFESLDPVALERIEIARGPASSLYGTDAVAGAVNVITRKGAGAPSLSASGAAGTYGSDRETFSAQGAYRKFAYNVSSSHFHRQEATENNSELETWNYAARFDYEILPEHLLKLIVRGVEYKKGFYESNASGYGSAVEPEDPNDTIHNNNWLTGLEYRGQIVPIWETIVRLGHFGSDHRNTSIEPNVESTVIDPPFNGKGAGRTFNQERRPTADWQNNVTVYECGHIRDTVTAGLYAEYESFNQDDTSFGNNVRLDHTNYAGYLQNRLELYDRAFLTLGARHERNEEFGGFTTARGDVSILIPESSSRVHGSVGNAFRAPGFQELFAPFFGEPNLQPEENLAYDVGFEQHFWKRRIALDATWFHNRFDQLIGFDFDTGKLANVGRARSRGFELQAAFKPDRRLSLEGTATLMSTENNDGKRLQRRPPAKYTARLVAHPLVGFVPEAYDGLDLSFELLHVSTRSDLGPTPDNSFATVRNKAFTRGDIAVSYRFLTHFRAFGRFENVGDVKYEETKTFPADGANALGGLEFSWRF